MSAMTAGGGLALAPARPSVGATVLTLIGTALAVASANALNMWWERQSDALMNRTRGRPLPSGQLTAGRAFWFGVAVGAAGLVLLWLAAGPLTAAIGLFALLSYVLVYTPLKRRTPWALVIGAVPGAAPPVMGWTAATGSLDVPALALFGILFAWQVPHFLAIAIRLSDDYARAGIRALPVVRGERAARVQSIAYAAAMLPISASLVPLGVAGPLYLVAAIGLGLWMLWRSLEVGPRANTRLFVASLVYLPALIAALAIDRLAG